MARSRVTERVRGETGPTRPTREAIRDGSRDSAAFRGVRRGVGPLAIAVSAVGLAAAVLMVLVDFLPIVSVDVASGSCEVIQDSSPDLAEACEQSGFERHGPAMILLGALCAAMAWGAGVGRSRAAAAALVAVGAVVLGIGLLVDLPVTDDTGAIGPRFEGATAQAEIGFTLELVAGALALVAGAAGWWLLRRE
jgi:hypothetical protein